MKHHIERTSPKGAAFLGTCRLCGAANLTMADAMNDCPNVRGLSETAALLETLSGPPKKDEANGNG